MISKAAGAKVEAALPHWICWGIDVAVAKWVNESETWAKEIADRMVRGKELTPKRQLKYDAFVAAPQRTSPLARLVVDGRVNVMTWMLLDWPACSHS